MIVLGVDGGGSKTAARVARVGANGELRTIGSGAAGPSNVRAVGIETAIINLEAAIRQATAGTDAATIDSAILALAGCSRADVKTPMVEWAGKYRLAGQFELVSDTAPVLALGVRDAAGVALIVGTGSVATGVNPAGERVLIGGWGHWFGDHGSGYDLGRRALSAMADAVDGLGARTELVAAVLQHLRIDDPRDALGVLGRAPDMRREIATLAPIALQVAGGGDPVAKTIAQDAALQSAKLVLAVAKGLGLGRSLPLALAGGIVCNSDYYRQHLLEMLSSEGLQPAPLTVVKEPVEGALLLARDRLNA